jgi:ubiquinone biosynthesis protein UbiJ
VSLFSLVLTPLRSGGGALARPATAVARPIGAVISIRSPLDVVGQMADDVRSIASSTNELTVAVEELDAIRRRVETLEVEVTRMREAVETVGDEVAHVRRSTEPLGRLAGRFGRRRPSAESL